MKTAFWQTLVLSILLLTYGCIGFHSGMSPIDPPGNKMLPSPAVRSLHPTLSWEPYTQDGIEELRYQLILSKYDASEYVTAYERHDIYEPKHTVAISLEPQTRYYWRVRALYKKEGRDFAGSWNGFSYFFFVPPIIGFSGGHIYSFDVE